MVERHTNCFDFPLDRCRWIMDDESFDIGDRTLHAVRPPVYDSPTTRGLFDPDDRRVLGGRHLRHAAARSAASAIADLDPEFWQFGMTLFALGAVSPWLSMVDHDKYGRYVDTVAGPRHHDDRRLPHPGDRRPVHRTGVRPVREFPTSSPPPLPDQSVLDQIIAATAVPSP